MKLVLAAIGILLISTVAFSATIYVPDNYANIQDAINASVNGDTVIVRAGTYLGGLNFNGKAICLRSEHGPQCTTISGGKSVVTFDSGETVSSVLDGFHITNGYDYHGGGISISSSHPTIINNIISGNSVSSRGGGISTYRSNAIIKNNIISMNLAGRSGGGISIESTSSPTIVGNTITGNKSNGSGNRGGGGVLCYQSSPFITNNTIIGNTATENGGGISSYSSAAPVVTNTILWNNTAINKNEIYIGGSTYTARLNVSFSDIEGGKASCYIKSGSFLSWGSGMIEADPLFVDLVNDDFHLTWPSPCRNAGDNTAVTELYDFEGDPRIALGTVDMGADEFYPHLYVGNISPASYISIRTVGPPNAWVWLVCGSGVLDPPIKTRYGKMYLQQPFLNDWLLGNIAADGVLRIPTMIPSNWLPGEKYPYQAMIGPASPYPALLTNPVVVTVE